MLCPSQNITELFFQTLLLIKWGWQRKFQLGVWAGEWLEGSQGQGVRWEGQTCRGWSDSVSVWEYRRVIKECPLHGSSSCRWRRVKVIVPCCLELREQCFLFPLWTLCGRSGSGIPPVSWRQNLSQGWWKCIILHSTVGWHLWWGTLAGSAGAGIDV